MNTQPANIAGYSGTANIRAILFDVFALAFIYFIPTLSHMLSIKLYMLEPMRIMVILAMMHTRRENAYILAFTLPLFSFLISAHPVLVKSALIAIELAAMAFIFFRLVRIVQPLIAIFRNLDKQNIVLRTEIPGTYYRIAGRTAGWNTLAFAAYNICCFQHICVCFSEKKGYG